MATESEIVKRKLQDLRVIDLRAELEKRGLDKTGVKAVLLERLQQALQKEGHNPDEYMFEVNEATPVKKPTKRTNKKLTRDDESETHSNVDESQNDLTLDDDEKMDSDDDRIDEKFFQVLETTDAGEDAIDLSIEEEEKLLTDEDETIVSTKEEEQADGSDDKSKKKHNGDDGQKTNASESTSPKPENTSDVPSATKDNTELDTSSSSKGEDHVSLIVHVDDAQNDLDTDMASPGQQLATGDGENQGDGEQDGKSSKAVSSVKKPSEEGQNKAECKNASSSVENVATPVNDEGESNEKSKAENKSATKGEKQQEEDKSTSASNKAKSTATSMKEGKVLERLKTSRPATSGKNLWVTGLSSTTRATDLKALFSKHGKVVGAKIVSNARSSASRCYGFVTMATTEEASKCIQHLHRTELHGRMISVERAKTEPIGPSKRTEIKVTPTVKRTPEKKDSVSAAVKPESEKKIDDEDDDKKEKEKEKETANTKEETETKDSGETKEAEVGGDEKQDDSKSLKKDEEKDKKEPYHRSRQSSASRKSSKERTRSRERIFFPRRPGIPFKDRTFGRRPFLRRPLLASRPRRNPLSFRHITAERMRQRQREEERELREAERRRRQDIVRQREIERKQREEAIRLERERERLRIERERLERERAEVLRLEREKQRMERERIEREREELRRRERMSRMDDYRRPMKRSFDNSMRGGRDLDFDDRKRPYMGGNSRRVDSFERKSDRFDSMRRDSGRRDNSLHDRDSRGDRFDRGPLTRDTDLRGHGRDDRGVSFRDSGDSISQSRIQSKDDWKGPPDRRSHHGVSRDRGSGNDGFSVDRSGDSWHGGVSQSERGGGSKPYSSGSGMTSSERWGGDRKSDSQSWGRSDGVQGERWGGGVSGGRSQQNMGMGQSLLSQPQSNIFNSQSGSGTGGMVGMSVGGSSSYNSDRFDAYKGLNSMRRF